MQRKALKRGQKVRTYGAAVKIHRKLYYIVGKNQYVKKSNF
ncbi:MULTISPECIES: SLAP domain-containing protein [unclassified Lactobacillus]|nr:MULTISPECIES: SLAP domain-containing protein [unclassified Lactobacillus]